MLSTHDEMTVGTDAPFFASPAEVTSTDEDAPDATAQTLAYSPHHIVGGSLHPGVIVETPGLANVEPPPIRYRPHLPKELSDSGRLSAMQLERIIYAGQAHEQRLADGSRAGISIGDGTGTGKTATLAGVILDNWFQWRRRAVWFSVKADLIEAVSDEFARLGLVPPIRLINDFPTDRRRDPIRRRDRLLHVPLADRPFEIGRSPDRPDNTLARERRGLDLRRGAQSEVRIRGRSRQIDPNGSGRA